MSEFLTRMCQNSIHAKHSTCQNPIHDVKIPYTFSLTTGQQYATVLVMQLVRCYREGGQQVFILTTIPITDEQHALDMFNAMATGPAEPAITLYQLARRTAPGVYIFRDE